MFFLTSLVFSVPVHAATEFNFSNGDYHLRISGAEASDFLGSWGAVIYGDLNNDGMQDLAIASPYADTSGETNNGAIYIYFNTLLDDYQSKGNTIKLHEEDVYSVRIEGASTNDFLGWTMDIADIDGDGKDDLIAGAYATDYNGGSSGSVYVIDQDLLSSYSGTGNIHSLSDSSMFTTRLDGPNDGWLGDESVHVADINVDGTNDLILGAIEADFNSRGDSGSVYVVYNELYTSLATQETGNVIDLTDTSEFNIRWDGASVGGYLGYTAVTIGDLNDNSLPDIVLDSWTSDNNGRNNSGSAFVIYDSLISSYSGTGNIIDLATTTNFNLRYDGPSSTSVLSSRSISIGDLDNDGSNDLLIGAHGDDHSGRTNSGAVYIFDSALLETFTGLGNELDLAVSTMFTTKLIGADGIRLGPRVNVLDYNNDGLNELFTGASFYEDGSGTNGGYLLIDRSAYINSEGTGNIIDLADGSKFTVAFVGEGEGNFGSIQSEVLFPDVNNDGILDFTITHRNFDIDGLADAGAGYLYYNFPHSVTISGDGGDITSSSGRIITGAVSAPNSFTTVSGVEYNVNDNNPTSPSWVACTATDGAFDSVSEDYSCKVSDQSEGTYAVYLRVYDSVGVYTAPSHYGSISGEGGNDFSIRTSKGVGSNGEDAISPDESTNANTIVFAWHQSTNVSHYKVYTRERGSHRWDEKRLGRSDDSYEKYFDEGRYEWKVRAVHTDGEVTDTEVYFFTVDGTIESDLTVDTINYVEPLNGLVSIAREEILKVVGTAEEGSSIYVRIWNSEHTYLYQTIECEAELDSNVGRSEYICEAPVELYGDYTLTISASDAAANEYYPLTIILRTY